MKLFIFPPFNLEKEVLQSNLRTVRLLQRERGGSLSFFLLFAISAKEMQKKGGGGRRREEGARSDLSFVNIHPPERFSCLHIPHLPLAEVFKKNHLLAETSIIQVFGYEPRLILQTLSGEDLAAEAGRHSAKLTLLPRTL